MRLTNLLRLPALLVLGAASAAALEPIADIHTHYKWNQVDATSPAEAIAALDANHVALAVVIGTPPEYALRLVEQDPGRIVALYSPYQEPADWVRWYWNEGLVADARAALESGRYHGIGELHLLGGFAPRWDRSAVIKGLIALGAEFDVPLLVHTEFSRPDYFLDLCSRNPKTRFAWAHAGGLLSPEQVAQVLEACPNVWVDLSARDPWRYVRNPITAGGGRLLPGWERLVMRFPDRFMVGSDPVWPVERLDAWDQPDTGWDEIGRFLDFHRRWLSHLPAEVAEKIRLTNGLAFYRPPAPAKGP